MPLSLYRFPFPAMGSRCEVQLYAEDKHSAEHIARLVIADVERIEQKYSRYRDSSDLSAINRAAASGDSCPIDAETVALLNYADTCYQQSDGMFDITSGILRRAWDFKSGQVPAAAQIDGLLARIGWQHVQVGNNEIRFAQAGMELDFGGIGKEYAVDRAATLCTENGAAHGLVDLGGDIRIFGPHADGRAWNIGIKHPRDDSRLLASIDLTQGAVSSSGDYERCIELDGQRYGHILNPKTGWPVRHLAATTVVADQCIVAGSASTISILREQDGPRWLTELSLPHVWMATDGSIGGTLAIS